jgi:small GTP-binding protein
VLLASLHCYKGNFVKKYRYFTQSFKSNRKQTLGVECFEKRVKIKDKTYLIKFWDTAGQEKFAVVSKNYYRVAHGIILTSSIVDRDSFINLKKWFKSIKENNTNDNLQLIIIGSKCDLEEERKVVKEEFEKLADEIKVKFFETSAKENINIDLAFDCIINQVVDSIYSDEKELENNRRTSREGVSPSFHLKSKDHKNNQEPKKCCK